MVNYSFLPITEVEIPAMRDCHKTTVWQVEKIPDSLGLLRLRYL